jgi:hypothetical protein
MFRNKAQSGLLSIVATLVFLEHPAKLSSAICHQALYLATTPPQAGLVPNSIWRHAVIEI